MFLITSLTLTIAANKAGNQSILDSNNIDEIEVDEPSGAPA